MGDLLQFVDGASIHGRLRQMSSGGAVEWEHPDARVPIEFGPSNIAWIRFEKPRTVNAPGQPGCRFRFNNGDEVFGNLSAIEGDTVQLETWFGGALKAPRQALQSIIFLSKGFSILYEGPTSAEGWGPRQDAAELGVSRRLVRRERSRDPRPGPEVVGLFERRL